MPDTFQRSLGSERDRQIWTRHNMLNDFCSPAISSQLSEVDEVIARLRGRNSISNADVTGGSFESWKGIQQFNYFQLVNFAGRFNWNYFIDAGNTWQIDCKLKSNNFTYIGCSLIELICRIWRKAVMLNERWEVREALMSSLRLILVLWVVWY